MNEKRAKELAATAAKIRLAALEAVHTAASGHIGGSLSVSDILAVLYFEKMRIQPENPQDPERDRFVLSKGHCSIEGHMSGHAEMHHVKGVDMSTGSLGQGLSVAGGMALAGKIDQKSYRVYAVMGDGEIEEGQIWEAGMAAAKYKLDKLCGIIDVNGLQIDGATADVMPSEPLDKKWEAFGWNVIKVDGHDVAAIADALDAAEQCKGKPTMILAKTTKGKGVSYMENNAGWHGKAPNDEQYDTGKAELEAILKGLEG